MGVGRQVVAGDSVPIEDHGVIGDLRTVALIGNEGTIDWLCYPHFDSPSIFASLLDPKKGGHWSIRPEKDGVLRKQFYWPDTNVLVTRFYTAEGVGELVDFMPMERKGTKQVREVIRRVRVVRGELSFEMECFPGFNYARDVHQTRLIDGGAAFESRTLQMTLSSSVKLERAERGVTARFKLKENQSAVFSLREGMRESCEDLVHDHESAESLFRDTVDYWRHWLSSCQYTGRWRETVQRSALALKLMTFEPTGAIVAAPTCSLPESPGGSRNWDYRFCWLRDAAFTVYAFLRIGFKKEAAAFMRWVEARCAEHGDGPLPLMFSLDGSPVPQEEELTHLEGYGGAKPVRIGNAAADQLQLDIYGELMDSVYLSNKYAAPISYDFWKHLRRLVDWVCEHWNQPDEGIWEIRGGRRHFVYSKLMCWVALDRAIRLADKRSFPADRARWLATRDAIFEDIMAQGWSEKRGSFIQAYGKDTLDAANLLMPLVFFLSPVDPRMLSMLDHLRQPPSQGGLASDGLVYRYDVEATLDGIPGSEGTFNLCSFWLVEAMTRAHSARPDLLEEARLMFERMLGYANHVGLYAEQTGMGGESLGNFPQALTHLSLISAAYNLDRTLGRKD
ncbi:Glucoamylase (glucan-1,4-alpha-glucosidase), GH15 family [Myxococcus fulvus]|uniref:Glucoamylase n=1 Tax=Myxococcus fulvus TaxID=33 RepID=A0A511TB35_MYXFU|nr:glycoside hydrolase family 15 protein [Myxococcus fulvus]GEN11391.1 glucoamylase [Myxococcus fulvus]SEU39939.1 Glucoamylase (glucan-1,4-alpha-glucosidase), GH15 family [Myxococcus fulvus]